MFDPLFLIPLGILAFVLWYVFLRKKALQPTEALSMVKSGELRVESYIPSGKDEPPYPKFKVTNSKVTILYWQSDDSFKREEELKLTVDGYKEIRVMFEKDVLVGWVSNDINHGSLSIEIHPKEAFATLEIHRLVKETIEAQ